MVLITLKRKTTIATSESVDFLHTVFEVFGPIATRRMFGGWGIYHEGLMFGLYFSGRLYLKTDTHNLQQFKLAGSEPFTYTQRGKPVQLSYWSAPESVFDESEQALRWSQIAWEAALRKSVKTVKSS